MFGELITSLGGSGADVDRVARRVLAMLSPSVSAAQLTTALQVDSPERQLEVLLTAPTEFLVAAGMTGVGYGLRHAVRARTLVDALTRSLDAELEHGIVMLTPHDELWPRQLDALDDRVPHALWVRGDARLPMQYERLIGVLGNGAPSAAAAQLGHHFAARLSDREHVVVVTGDPGVADFARAGVARVASGPLVVLSGGVQPAGAGVFATTLADRGALVSATPTLLPATRSRRELAGRLVSALSPTAVLIEAHSRSHSLNVAMDAMGLGRTVWVVPGSTGTAHARGSNALLRSPLSRVALGPDDVPDLDPSTISMAMLHAKIARAPRPPYPLHSDVTLDNPTVDPTL